MYIVKFKALGKIRKEKYKYIKDARERIRELEHEGIKVKVELK